MRIKKKDNITYLNESDNLKKFNKKKITIAIILGILLLTLLILFVVYCFNRNFRSYVDMNVFRKTINSEKLSTIKVEDANNANIFAYRNCIAVLKDNKLRKYNSSGKLDHEIDIEITDPIIDTKGVYIAAAEKEGRIVYLLNDNGIIWTNRTEGNITRVTVNSSGYVAVITSGTSYKSVIVLYDNQGKELFKTFLSSTVAVDLSVSDDSNYLGYAEISMSGTVIQSNIKIVSIDKAKDNPSDAIIHSFKGDVDSLIIGVKYQGNRLVCLFDDSIHVVHNDKDKKILNLKDEADKISFADINLDGHAYAVLEGDKSLFKNNLTVQIVSSGTETKSNYMLDGAVTSIRSYGNRIGINTGSQIHIIDTSGWLIKKYNSNKDIQNFVMSDDILGIIYKDKIELLNI